MASYQKETPKHTPKDWKVIETPTEYQILSNVNGQGLVATVSRYSPITLRDKTHAKPNADLIAAAPELFEALEGLVHFHDTDDTPALDWWAKARAAISKALGR